MNKTSFPYTDISNNTRAQKGVNCVSETTSTNLCHVNEDMGVMHFWAQFGLFGLTSNIC